MVDKPDVLVVGAGIFGLTVAERLATLQGKKVLARASCVRGPLAAPALLGPVTSYGGAIACLH